MDSPRGRILLMRSAHEEGGELSVEQVERLGQLPGLHGLRDRLPVGRAVRQADRGHARPGRAQRDRARALERLHRTALFALFPHPGRLRALAPLMALQQATGALGLLERLGPARPRAALKAMLRVAPEPKLAERAAARCPTSSPARGERRGTVAMLPGCVQRVFFADVNRKTARRA